jgi:hypothetical protein
VTGNDIRAFSLIKLSSITHGINTDLRYLSVPFVKSENGSYTLTSHENPNVLTVMPQEILPETGQYLRVQGILEDYGETAEEMDSRA